MGRNHSYILLLFLTVLVAACWNQTDNAIPSEGSTAEYECTTDSDCSVGGCSGEICSIAGETEGTITTCEFKEEYVCFDLTSCGCVQNKCAWRENTDYLECIGNY